MFKILHLSQPALLFHQLSIADYVQVACNPAQLAVHFQKVALKSQHDASDAEYVRKLHNRLTIALSGWNGCAISSDSRESFHVCVGEEDVKKFRCCTVRRK
jgi:hypothetical protein